MGEAKQLYARKDLKTEIEALLEERRSLRKELIELEREQKESGELAAENTALRKEVEALRPQFVQVVTADRRTCAQRRAPKLIEILSTDLERVRLQREKQQSKKAA